MRPVVWPLMVLGLLLDGAAGACVSAWVAPLPLLQRSAGHRTWPGAGDGAAALSMLNRAKKNARNEDPNRKDSRLSRTPDGASNMGGTGTFSRAASEGGQEFGDWGPSKRSQTGMFTSAADEIQDWISRSLLSKNEADREPLQAIINEFKSDVEIAREEGGAIGQLREGPASWAKRDPNRDIDPSGVVAAAVANMDNAERMNMTYREYVERFVRPSREPTVEVIQPNRRQLPATVEQLVTAPFRYPVYSLLPRVPYCTCWYGVFFEVEALHTDVEITGLYSQSGEYWRDLQVHLE